MRFFLDLTTPQQLVLAFRRQKKTEIRVISTSPRTQENVIKEIDVFLQHFHQKPQTIHEMIVVAGPGKFSDLRVAATIANIFSSVHGTKLFVVRHSKVAPEDGSEYLVDLERRKRAVKTVRPLYGRPPSITRPKRR